MSEPIYAQDDDRPRRFLTLEEVQHELAISPAQTYALVRNQELRAIKIGGRGQYRVERQALEDYIVKAYKDTARFLGENPHNATVRKPGEE